MVDLSLTSAPAPAPAPCYCTSCCCCHPMCTQWPGSVLQKPTNVYCAIPCFPAHDPMPLPSAETRRQRHEARQAALRANQPKGLPPHVLNNLTSFTIKNQDEHSTDDLDCTICQEDLCQEKFSSLPCGHMFHRKCIKTWLKRKATCPT